MTCQHSGEGLLRNERQKMALLTSQDDEIAHALSEYWKEKAWKSAVKSA